MTEKIHQETSARDEKWEELVASLPKPLDCFKKLHTDQNMVFKLLKEYALNIVPLRVVGTFFNYVGNHILNHITNEFK